MQDLSDSITTLDGLGLKTAQKLNNIGIYTLWHLLFHLPYRYQNKTKITPLSNIQVGKEYLVRLTIGHVKEVNTRRKQLICYLHDENNLKLILRFFNFSSYQKIGFNRGGNIECFGEIKISRQGLEMHHPDYSLISQKQKPLIEKTLSPIYPLTADIRQLQLKKWIKSAIKVLQDSNFIDYFKNVTKNYLPTMKQSIITLHYPNKFENIDNIKQFKHPAQKRLIIEEFCANRISLLEEKTKHKTKISNTFTIKNNLSNKLLKSIEFKLTNAQKKSIAEINQDLSSNHPMLRLLQGDVGSGKTIVAVFSCLQAIENGFQAAIMVPTEILSFQHLTSFSKYTKPLNIKLSLLNSSQNAKQKKQQLADIKSGEAKIIIGTHSLFQENVVFDNLGLIIIDEQHKFGVHQRLLLSKKAKNTPHQLIMTATPIPRSLTMSAYAYLSCSIIDEIPPGRKQIKTIVINNTRKHEVIEKIKQVCENNNQAYWVCTLIEESENMRDESAKNTFEYLKNNLPNLSIALVHSKLDKDEKQKIMLDFANGDIDVLVATTVIEVGLNVINASLMIIENTERLGLAQLHQLRGRIGRGNDASICILMYQKPLSKKAAARLGILRQTNDGFKIAQKDLELRGPGEILGTQQTGITNMQIANIVRDGYLLETVNFYSNQLLKINKDELKTLINRWITEKKIKYANT